MKPSTRRIGSMPDQAMPDVAGSPARITRLRTASSSNDARHGGASALGGEAWPWHMVAPTPPHGADANAASSMWPTYRLYQEAQRRRAAMLGNWFEAAIRAVRIAARRLGESYARFRRARETYRTLQQLDDRTLRDLGFTRDEIRSVAVEMASQGEPTRRLARPTFPAHPSLFDLLFRN